jgi:hypothetical protein
MGFSDVEQKMSGRSNGLAVGFGQRPDVNFPELANSGRHESQTAKYDVGITRY